MIARFICGENVVRKWRNCGAKMVKMMCENGKIVVWRWWLGFAISVEIHCVTAVAWCVSGVSNPDFPNFTKHSTVLTSILQQISILYQHFPSVKTAIPALEQAKTMLKIALPTFKNDENHTQNSKIHIQNSGYEVRCGECGGGFLYFGCQGGEMVVRLRHVLSWLRRFLCVIQMIAMFICGENAVRKWRNCGVFSACTCLISCIFVAKVAKLRCDCGGWLCGCGVFVFGFFMI